LKADAPPQASSEDAPGLAVDVGKIAHAQKMLEAEKQKHAETRAALEEARGKLAAAALEEQAGPGDDEKAAGPQYDFPAVTKALRGVDWKATGIAINKMGPLMEELAESLAGGKGLPSSVGELQRWNSPLLTMALEARREGVTGTGIPGTFSNVVLAVNMMHAALAQSDVPLDESQTRRLGEIARRFVAEDERRLAAYDEATYQLVKEMEEAALKDRFYSEALALLTPEQEEVLHPASIRGRVGLDLFSSAVLWNGLCAPIKFQEIADLQRSLADLVMQRAKIPVESRALLDELTADWVRGLPAEFLTARPDPLFSAGMELGGSSGMPVESARIAAEHELRFLRALHDRLPVDSDVAKRVRGAPIVAVPVLWKPQGAPK